ncbi:hypothetical protein [Spiroplasma monobiae]|uniref:Uncharacterized protein n=1 Tax=Spiroplasma monobiae MQ-1 TaxID=1336748 RepID=A0A2K9LVD9_SPISQ|nr:hypothetical protein [Spiroplasma monobiae]AUM62891.1 hypothetical protein SMONO_v1c06420 [Spiroplasma monobiae MQ-1]
MKKMLSVWLSLGLTVSGAMSTAIKNENKVSSKYSRYLTSMDDFLYYKTLNRSNVANLSEEEVKELLKETFYSDSLGKEIFNNLDNEIISLENGELTVLFKDKERSSLLKEKIILQFNLVSYNYDNIDEFTFVINKFLEYNPVVLSKNNYIQIEIEDLLKEKFKTIFDTYAANQLYLDDIDEFWEFIDFEQLENNKHNVLNSNFLNDKKIVFNFLRDSESFSNNNFDKYVNFSVNENIFKKEIFNWIKKHSFFKSDVKNYDDIFKIENISENKITISLSNKTFTKAKLITLNKIK